MDRVPHRPLRVLIVRAARDPIADWQAMLLDRLAVDPLVTLVGVVAGQGARTARPGGALLGGILSIERRLVAGQLRRYDTSGARAILSALSQCGAPQDSDSADLAIVLGARDLSDDQLNLARHGSWSVRFAGAASAVWPAASATQRASPRMPVEILSRTIHAPSCVLVRTASYNLKPGAVLTGAFVEEKSVLLIVRALHDLATGQLDALPSADLIPPPVQPNVAETLGYAVSFAKAAAVKLRHRMRARRGKGQLFWRLAAGAGCATDLDLTASEVLPAHSHTMADPFLFEHDGTTWVFYEAMNADDGAGWIEAAQLTAQGLGKPVTALTCPYHLSFPFVFRDGDEIFMMPETQQSRRLEVWRATDFPTGWTLHATAFEGMYLADSILWHAEDGQWWLLTNLSDHFAFQDHSSELYLFSIDGPSLGGLTPHPRNPVAIGAGHARNAGALIPLNGRLFRPSQNNSHGVYGYGLNLMEITRLDDKSFEEILLRQWTPDDLPGSRGIHHLSVLNDRYVFDWSGS
ncbi:glucosamine inositolphosphorylceramide transferase family protein [Pseudosulfitobacter pseudonitzschiae]|uniref:glucosamine inositolphosphorylceramide transferase family protein n=1 Tax=Pseudosulfitobacter pseudonitzschiae TaxID=1402135 RepID=UPI001AF59CDC|nr:hypothetical protein [Pseudosulfitobacter pseudonitzschiae]MBM1815986.1 hypothetical protein [Pseudosulfitobacter pseudonitzschiae]MBM1833292.1 hypothetical protein [Pseudosulfitobacter pseudonitzschiae]MBM1838159.1 hypothetical protein [Pseudosulfitobacter pseudonitzschiae]MBM1842691.1 hypothetical protein [Pseudosulfitobacter pseudonitzschiae]MBM1847557.1 hypothetical protein [Pseudosulfitobacter pseudonitzschiae]